MLITNHRNHLQQPVVALVAVCVIGACAEPPTTPEASPPISAAVQQCSPPQGATHWWPGDYSTEDLVGANPGTLVGGATYAPGLVGGAFSFDGVDDYMAVGDVLDENAGTVEFWVNRGPNDIDQMNTFFGSYPTRTPTFWIFVSSEASQTPDDLIWDFGEDLYYQRFGRALPPGEWHHLAMTWERTASTEPSTVRAYFDGVLVGTGSSYVPEFAIPPVIGAYSYGEGTADEYANALIDEFTIYNRALTDAEIAGIAGAGARGKCGSQLVFSGFFAPVDNEPVLNLVTAGRSIPLKFGLGGDKGLDVLASGSPSSTTIACPSGAAVDPIEETTVSRSGLTYDAATGQYNYVWQTDKHWAKSCRRLTLRLADNTSHSALFQFR